MIFDTQPPDYVLADSLIAALIEAGALTVKGVSYERTRHQYRVEVNRRFVGYARTLTRAVELKQEVRREKV